MNLLYLNDPGIFKKHNKFFFNNTKKEVTDHRVIERILQIKVPPAWENVWYASNKKCHIQVHGTDKLGKKQYILSEEWINNAKCEKYNRMKRFIRNLNSFKHKIKLKSAILNKTTLIHLLFNLLIDTHIRVGNEIYAEQNKTYGLTTLRQKHLKLINGNYYFEFVGKSKIKHNIIVPSEYNNILSKLNDKGLFNKNKPLFNVNNVVISSEELNNYLKEHMGKEYTCKDFRTYSANILFIKTFLKKCKSESIPKTVILESIDESAKSLGHTRNISKKSYISNNLLDYCLNSFVDACGSSVSSLLSKVWS